MSIRKLEDTIYVDFTTHNPTTGAVSDADSTPTCEVFEDANDTAVLSPTVTKRTAKTGNYRVPIAATTGNGFEVGKSYNVIVSATVATVMAKARIASFTLDGKRVSDLNDIANTDVWSDATRPAGGNLDATISSRGTADPGDAMDLIAGAVDAAAIATGAIDADAIAADAITNAKIAAGAITSSEAPALANLDATVSSRSTLTQAQILSDTTPFAGANIDATISSRGTADPGDAMDLIADAVDAAALAASAGTEIASAVWAATGALGKAYGLMVTELNAAQVIRVAQLQAGAAQSATLDAGAAAQNDYYNRSMIVIVSGSGAGQTRLINDYNGTTKVANLNRPWVVNPTTNDYYAIMSLASVRSASDIITGQAQGGGSTYIDLATTASSLDNFYNRLFVLIESGTGADQARLISSYTGSTRRATVARDWVTNPDSTSRYVILPSGSVKVSDIDDDAITAASIAAGAITASEAPLLANLDAAVSSRSAAAGTKGTDNIYDEVITHPTLAEIEASTVLAKEATTIETKRIVKNKLTINDVTNKLELWNDAGDAVILSWDLTDKDGNPIVLTGTGPANRGVPS